MSNGSSMALAPTPAGSAGLWTNWVLLHSDPTNGERTGKRAVGYRGGGGGEK